MTQHNIETPTLVSEFEVGDLIVYRTTSHGEIMSRDNEDRDDAMKVSATIVKVIVTFDEIITLDIRGGGRFRVKNNRVEYLVFNGIDLIRCLGYQVARYEAQS